MGRKKKDFKDKKQTVSIQIPNELLPLVNEIENKSKFFEWLLIEYFNNINQNID